MTQQKMGAFLAALRKQAGLTQQQLAQELGVSDKSVSRWETGVTAPDLSLLPVLAERFDVSCDELLAGQRKAEILAQGQESNTAAKATARRIQTEQFKITVMTLFLLLAGQVLCAALAWGARWPVVGSGGAALCCLAGACLVILGGHNMLALLPECHAKRQNIWRWAAGLLAGCMAGLALALPHLAVLAQPLPDAVLTGPAWAKFAGLALAGTVCIAMVLLGFFGRFLGVRRPRAVLALALVSIMAAPACLLLAKGPLAAGVRYDSFEQFKQAIEQPVGDPEVSVTQLQGSDGVTTVTHYGERKSYVDRQGRVYRYYHGNEQVVFVLWEEDENGVSQITTYTQLQLEWPPAMWVWLVVVTVCAMLALVLQFKNGSVPQTGQRPAEVE